jgi:nucleoside-diphosphate-sugar epimerase
VERVVLCSSYTVYRGLKQRAPEGELVEDFSLRSISDAPPSVYAVTKLGAEWLGHCYQAEYGVEFAAVRFAGVFGPWHGTPSGGPSQNMAKLIESAFRGQRCRVSRGDLERASEYVYTADAAQGAVKAARAARSGRPVYNIGMGRLYSGREIVELIEELSGRRIDLDVYEGGTFSGYENELLPGHLDHARASIGFAVEYPMERAIGDYLGWLERQR